MKHEDFKDTELKYVQIWVIVDTEGYYAHMFEDIEKKEDEGEVVVDYDEGENPMHATTI